ncbi:MAG: hypothetical protein M3P51_12410 [Chloroflexota bacterium]|nr:hypothetical protein [Chloroflexota bacterium]
MRPSRPVAKVTARAGFGGAYPENTQLAFRRALEAGADRIELDVHRSTDGRLVVHHYYNLGHTNDGEGLVFERDSAYLRSLDAGSWFSPDFRGERIPFLEEVLEAFGDSIEYEVDLKGLSIEFLDAVLNLIRGYGLIDRVEFTSALPFLLARLKEMQPDATIGSFVRPFPEWMSLDLGQAITKGHLLLGRVDVAHCPLGIMTQEYVRDLQASGIRVHASNADTEQELRAAFELGVDQLSTNSLRLALSVRQDYEA